ncbi:MAG: RDD family protein, partial [Bdellovibrionales bacterium]|nr:RDD family protein [Bdellovibrionales bacterium]
MDGEIKIHNRHAFDNWKVASPFSRTSAFLADSVLVLSILIGILFWLDISPNSKTIFLLWFAGIWIWDAIWISFFGSTPAKKAVGLYVYSPRFDGAPHPIQVCVRIITFWFGFIIMGLGLTPILVRKDRRGWHDHLSETLVLGPRKSTPGSVSQSVGQGFTLAQVLIVFGIIGAWVLSLGIKGVKSAERLAIQCEDPQVIMK